MNSFVEYGNGRLVMPPEFFMDLVRWSETQHDRQPLPLGVRHSFESAGVIDDGKVAPELIPVVAAVVGSVCDIALSLDDETITGWVSPDRYLLLVPHLAHEGTVEVVCGHPTLLPIRLVELVGLGPRPTERIDGPDLRVDRQWRVAVTWGSGRAGRREVEVLDTSDGLRLVDRREAPVLLQDVSPTDVFSRVTGLLPTTAELFG